MPDVKSLSTAIFAFCGVVMWSRPIQTSDSLVTSGSVFSQNQLGGQVQYGYPISEYSTLTFGLGYRDAEIRKVERQSPADLRILVIGDSFTEAVGVDYTDSFTFKLEEKLSSYRWKPEYPEILRDSD